MAEGVGFEPTAQGLPVHGISSAAPSAARSPLRAHTRPAAAAASDNLAEGRGFEPPRDLLGPYPISSRTPSTGLGHPSASTVWNAHGPRDDHGGYCHDLLPSQGYPSGDKPGSKRLPGYATFCRRAGKTCSLPPTHARVGGCPSPPAPSLAPSPSLTVA